MDNSGKYRGLNFDRSTRVMSPRIISLAIAAIIFTLVWWALPPSAVYWMTLIAIRVLVWTASFAWREALSRLIRLLHSLERF